MIFTYTTYFFELANVNDPFLGNLIVQVILVVGIVVSFYLLDKVGRRFLVNYGGGALGFLCLLFGGLGFLPPSDAAGIGLVSISSVWAFIYAISMAPIGTSPPHISGNHQRLGYGCGAMILTNCDY